MLSPQRDIPGGRRAGRRILAGQLHDERGHPGRHGRRQRGHALVEVREGHHQGLARERDMPGQALMRDHAERVQVGRGRRGRPGHPLRRQVGRGPDQHPGLGDRRFVGRVSDPEVGDLDQAVRPDQQVSRLDVTVDQPGPVGGGQPPGRLGDDVHHVLGRQRPVVQHPGQRQPVHELHHQVSRLGGYGLPVVEDLGDVRVRQRARIVRLGPEPGQAFLVVLLLGPDDLDRYPAVDGQVGATPDLTHPTGRDEHIQPVPPPKHKPRHPHTLEATRTHDDHSLRFGTESTSLDHVAAAVGAWCDGARLGVHHCWGAPAARAARWALVGARLASWPAGLRISPAHR